MNRAIASHTLQVTHGRSTLHLLKCGPQIHQTVPPMLPIEPPWTQCSRADHGFPDQIIDCELAKDVLHILYSFAAEASSCPRFLGDIFGLLLEHVLVRAPLLHLHPSRPAQRCCGEA